ncbi:hypothetical protein RIF29_21230 [Crotalaria pallida]|uniref:DUF4283 domain-containing protein n=1 Tax=Crotalaria pallida TaxID=3830 RepID=A0AAN9F723_CROPI
MEEGLITHVRGTQFPSSSLISQITSRPRFEREAIGTGTLKEQFEKKSMNRTDVVSVRSNTEESSNHHDVEIFWQQQDLVEAQKCFVGKLLNRADVLTFQETLFKEGFFTITSLPLRGNWVLLKGREVEEIPELLLEEKAWIDAWFSIIKRWAPEFKTKERLALISTESLTRIDRVLKEKIGTQVCDICFMMEPVGGASLKEEKGQVEMMVDSGSDDDDISFPEELENRWVDNYKAKFQKSGDNEVDMVHDSFNSIDKNEYNNGGGRTVEIIEMTNNFSHGKKKDKCDVPRSEAPHEVFGGCCS